MQPVPVLHQEKICSPEDQVGELAVQPPCHPKDFGPHQFIITAALAALEVHIAHQSCPVGEYKIQHSTSPCWFFCHLEKEVIINAGAPRLLMPCCVVSPTDFGVVEVPHEHQSL